VDWQRNDRLGRYNFRQHYQYRWKILRAIWPAAESYSYGYSQSISHRDADDYINANSNSYGYSHSQSKTDWNANRNPYCNTDNNSNAE